jgi:hypothetical protein
MPITKSSLSSIIVARTHFPLFCRLIEQPDVIATKFGVSPMEITYTPLQCIIYTSLMDASFRYHVTMKDTHHLAHFALLHRLDIFWTPFGTASYSLSTVTHARVPLADQNFVHFYQDTSVVAALYAA